MKVVRTPKSLAIDTLTTASKMTGIQTSSEGFVAIARAKPNRIRELCRSRKLTYADLGKIVDPPAHEVTIAKLANGKQRLTQEWMNRLAKALNVTPAEIIQAAGFAQRRVAVVGILEAGRWSKPDGTSFEAYDVSIPDGAGYREAPLYAAEMHGDSMNKRYPHGSIIVLSRISGTAPSEIRDGSRYHVRRTRSDGSVEETLQRLTKDDRGQWWLKPESRSPEFQQWTRLEGVNGITVELLGRVRYALVPED